MKLKKSLVPLVLCYAMSILSVTAQTQKKYHTWAPTPPLGWNSWDCFGTTVTEQQIKEQADAMAKYLLPSGYKYLTVDIQWYEPEAKGHAYDPKATLTMDEYGRLTPGLKKFPSAANGVGFKVLADYVHSKGLKFGIHIMRGIPRQAVEKNTPVLGTTVKAQDIAVKSSTCSWNPDMYGVDATKPEGQAYYNSIVKMYADWGVDIIKCDDISRPYDDVQKAEVEALRKAIDKTDRQIILSLSPGATPVKMGEHVMNHANMWRITDDFWDRWGLLLAMFERLDAWTPYRGPGHFPDADMLPIGIVEFTRPTNFTKNEQYTLMSMWAIGRSPLIFGGDMTKLDDFTKEMLTNPEMLKVNQQSTNNRQVSRDKNLIVWTADVPKSKDKYVALFNAQSKGDNIDFSNADYSSPIIAGKGSSQKVEVSVKDGKKLVLFVKDGGNGFDWDHVVWVDPVLHGPKGDLKLTSLKWINATAGWGEARVNRTCDNRPIIINNKPAEGIGTHGESVIIYDLPEGYDTFTATGVVTQEKGSVVFGVLVSKGGMDFPEKAQVKINFESIGLKGKVKVHDLWSHKDLGTFKGSFGRELPQHSAGLYRLTPIK
ncbi:Glycosyl hydrolase family 98 putative carbohydrate binding module [Paludibacter propionicigenes WB4]|uniref:Alpha-galactosidase n=1 Tax=Paludibacter propionicigenes (strain DSM 17365 / JCM 13257 / WB4) TaxID=694427 RepID=E4T4X3_PALPW|nr:NPCBM/NEW2 domain-containing protein [Paludibacter propionicigenes]ADQ79767.1 Glycosyl hydrolase family 98 putative carbohydrate binding module [Paludibacter propionicigenes WB4]